MFQGYVGKFLDFCEATATGGAYGALSNSKRPHLVGLVVGPKGRKSPKSTNQNKKGGDDSFFFLVGKMLGYGNFFLGSSLQSFDFLGRKSGPGHMSSIKGRTKS